jgi:hypothetical protein
LKTWFLLFLMVLGTAARASTITVAANSPTTGSAIVTPDVATGILRVDGFTFVKPAGELAVCPKPPYIGCDTGEMVSPQEAVSLQFPKARYVGFQLIEVYGGAVVYLYYKAP